LDGLHQGQQRGGEQDLGVRGILDIKVPIQPNKGFPILQIREKLILPKLYK
jgi:hypothetical protein